MKRYQYNLMDNILEVTDESIDIIKPTIQRTDCSNEVYEIFAENDNQAKLLIMKCLNEKISDLKTISAFYKGRVEKIVDLPIYDLPEIEI